MTHFYPAWLKQAVVYQIYPQSFLDTNGDGIGDLPGITRKLDYIRSLGCNAVWLNPCFVSPFGDAGYDVADYCRVAPRYGTNADLRALCRGAARRGMRVILDLVIGHTSVEHPWFRHSCQAKPNKYSNWYIWTDSVWSGAPGFGVVNGFAERDGNYVTNFFHFQPALNFGFAHPDPKQPWQLPINHPDVLALRAEIRRIMRFWLDLGVSGYRVDMAASLIKNDPDKRAIRRFWQEERAWLAKEYPEAVLIAEWSSPKDAIAAGFHVDFMIHCGTPAYTALFRREPERFGFDPDAMFPGCAFEKGLSSFFARAGTGNIDDFLKYYIEHYRATRNRGFISLPTGNHDFCRIRYGRDLEDLKLVYAFLFTMPGLPVIYYGDEIGLRHQPGLTSKEGGYNRTGARTPMQWDSTANAGFSTAAGNDLYLPVDPRTDRPTVAAQETAPDSLLHHVRALLKLRARHPALGNDGEFIVLYAKAKTYPFVYGRSAARERCVIAVNPSDRPCRATFELPKGFTGAFRRLAGADAELERRDATAAVTMEPRSYGVWAVTGQ